MPPIKPIIHRSASDLALRVISGEDLCDSGVIPMPFRRSEASLHGLRIALYTDDGMTLPCAATVKTLQACGKTLKELGARVDVLRPGTSANGLPVAKAWHEHIALAVAAQIEKVWPPDRGLEGSVGMKSLSG